MEPRRPGKKPTTAIMIPLFSHHEERARVEMTRRMKNHDPAKRDSEIAEVRKLIKREMREMPIMTILGLISWLVLAAAIAVIVFAF